MACNKMKEKCGLLKFDPKIGHHLVPQRHKKPLKVKNVSTSLHIPDFVHLVSLVSFGFRRYCISISSILRSFLSNKASLMQFGGHFVGQINPQSQVCSSAQILPSFDNGAHFGFKCPELFLQVLWIGKKQKILSCGHKNSGINCTQA